MQHELFVVERRAQPVFHSNAPREPRIHVDAVMQVLLARRLRLFEGGFGVLHEFVWFLSVLRIAGEPGFYFCHNLVSVDAERPIE